MTNKPVTNALQTPIEAAAPSEEAAPNALPFNLTPADAAMVAAQTGELTEADFEKLVTGELAAEMESFGGVQLPRVKVPSGGGIAFEIPGADPDEPEVSKTITGTVIAHHAINRYYALGMDASEGKNNAPDCTSNDGVVGVPAVQGQGYGGLCADCPLNVFGSGKNGGKACSNRHRLLYLAEGQIFPWIVDVTPTSLKRMREYAAAQLIHLRRPLWALVTTIGLEKVKGASADYAEMTFKTVRTLTPAEAMAAKAKGEQYTTAGV